MSKPSSPGVRTISPVSPNPDNTPCASSSVPLLTKVTTPGTGVAPNALAHNSIAVRFGRVGVFGGDEQLDLSAAGRHRREVAFHHVDARLAHEPEEHRHALS